MALSLESAHGSMIVLRDERLELVGEVQFMDHGRNPFILAGGPEAVCEVEYRDRQGGGVAYRCPGVYVSKTAWRAAGDGPEGGRS